MLWLSFITSPKRQAMCLSTPSDLGYQDSLSLSLPLSLSLLHQHLNDIIYNFIPHKVL